MLKGKLNLVVLFSTIFLSFFFLKPADASCLTRVRAYATIQAIQNTTFTKIDFDNENFDTCSEFDPTSQRFTALTSGYYKVFVQVLWTNSVVGSYHYVYLSETESYKVETDFYANGTGSYPQVISTVIYLDVDDYLEVFTYQNTGADSYLYGGSDLSYFEITALDLPMDNIFFTMLVFGGIFIIFLTSFLILKLKK
jgi:hypothetical protein